jgi:hypothetical protein
MANIPIWPGSSSFSPGDTPFGFYDSDAEFQTDADKVAKFCSLRLGYPIENVELQAINFYTAFEEAVTVYGNELYAFKVRDNMLSLEGYNEVFTASAANTINHALITPTMASIVRLSEQYGEEAGVGGEIDWYSGSIALTASIQDYDLGQWAIDNNITGGIEIKEVYYQPAPAVNEMYTPYTGFGMGLGGAYPVGAAGFGMGPGLNFLMMPISYNLQLIQEIEIAEQVNLANYTFQLINNKLRIFPVPGTDEVDPETGYRSHLWFRYIKIEDRINSAVDLSASGSVTNESNVPYNNPTYSQLNSVGRSWIFEYTLALSKEMLGYVRGKYQTVPIPGAEVTLNQADLISAATAEKDALIERLREYFDSTSRQSLLERRAAESVARKSELGEVPMTIFIG